ncbi:hypothetical protein DFH27DRAFT_541241 [Peziza echinospora]|nr:hypothetical protein DFH27DRAFT_541241 [Peziza echinospora]
MARGRWMALCLARSTRCLPPVKSTDNGYLQSGRAILEIRVRFAAMDVFVRAAGRYSGTGPWIWSGKAPCIMPASLHNFRWNSRAHVH